MKLTSTVDTWRQFAIASCAFVSIAAGLHFANNGAAGDVTVRAVEAIAFSVQTFGAAIVLGFIIWGGARIVTWKSMGPDMKDTVLWTASLFGLVWVAVSVMR